LGDARNGTERFLDLVEETIKYILNKVSLSAIEVERAQPAGDKIEIVCTLIRTTNSALTVFGVQSLIENVKSEWYRHYLTSLTEPDSFSTSQRDVAVSEIVNYGIVSRIHPFIFASIILVAFWLN